MEEKVRKRLTRVLERYEKLISDLENMIRKANEEARKSVLKEVREIPPITLRTPLVESSGAVRSIVNLLKYVPEKANSYEVHGDLRMIYGSLSEDYGRISVTGNYILTVNPEHKKKFMPPLHSAFGVVESALLGMREIVGEALTRCAKYLGNDTKYYNCVADTLEIGMDVEELKILEKKEEELEKELEDLFKALVREYARRH